MFTIIGGVIGVIFDSISLSNWKKALDITTLSKGLFKIYAQIIGFFMITLLVLIYGIDLEIITNFNYLLIILLTVFLSIVSTFIHLSILKTTKLSELLPYENLDKLFIVVIGFFLFNGTDKGVSTTTLLITIATLILILLFTVDLKNIKLPKKIGLFILYKGLNAVKVLIIGFILIKYSSLTFASIDWIFEILMYILILYFTKDQIKNLLKQQKSFYINRTIGTLCGRTASIIGLIIIKEVGIIIATLLGFLGLAFNIFAMKLILNDSPTKKQIILAFVVILMIGFGFNFK